MNHTDQTAALLEALVGMVELVQDVAPCTPECRTLPCVVEQALAAIRAATGDA